MDVGLLMTLHVMLLITPLLRGEVVRTLICPGVDTANDWRTGVFDDGWRILRFIGSLVNIIGTGILAFTGREVGSLHILFTLSLAEFACRRDISK